MDCTTTGLCTTRVPGRRYREDDFDSDPQSTALALALDADDCFPLQRARRVREDDCDSDSDDEDEMPSKRPRVYRRVREDDCDSDSDSDSDSDDEWMMHNTLEVGAAHPHTLPADTPTDCGDNNSHSDCGDNGEAPLTEQDKLWQSIALNILTTTKPGAEQKAMCEMVRRIRTLAPPATGLASDPPGIVIPCSADAQLLPPLDDPAGHGSPPVTIHFAPKQYNLAEITAPARVVIAGTKRLATWNKRTGKFTTRRYKTLDKLARAALGPHHRRPHVPHTN